MYGDEMSEVVPGDVIYVEKPGSLEPLAEIVLVACVYCGETHIGTKREAGGFIAGHLAFHNHMEQMASIVEELGGT